MICGLFANQNLVSNVDIYIASSLGRGVFDILFVSKYYVRQRKLDEVAEVRLNRNDMTWSADAITMIIAASKIAI